MTENLPEKIEQEALSSTTLFNPAAFEHAQRVAKMLMTSTMIPEHFRENLGNVMIALNFAARQNIDPFMTMQKMYVIHGKPGIEAQLAIALVNKSGKFSPIKYKLTGDGDKRECTAYAKEKATGEVFEGPQVSIDMAKKEGWHGKKGSKWQTMPEVMLRYRSAMFFARAYCPEALLGIESIDEIRDYVDLKKNKAGEYGVDQEVGDIKVIMDKVASVEKIDTSDDFEFTKETFPEEYSEACCNLGFNKPGMSFSEKEQADILAEVGEIVSLRDAVK